MADGVQFKQVFGANIDAIATGGAFGGIDHGQAVFIHRNRVEIADIGAIRHAEATPRTAFATAADQRGSAAGMDALVLGAGVGNVRTACARESGDALFCDCPRSTPRNSAMATLLAGALTVH